MWSVLWFFQTLVALSYGSFIDHKFSFKSLRAGRISGGTEAARNQFPYQVAFFVYRRDGQSICGGSILSSTWLLSAAHCFFDFESADVLAGVHNILQDDPGYELEVFPSDVVIHAQYNSAKHSYDISAIKTSKKPIVFNAAIQAIPLIARSMANNDFTNTIGRIAGWGRTNDASADISPRLLFIEAPIISNADCARTYGSIVTSSNICLSGSNARSTCQGDSGGPLTITSGGRQVQVGIVSFGTQSGCQRGYATAFVRVSSFHDWIQTTTGIKILSVMNRTKKLV